MVDIKIEIIKSSLELEKLKRMYSKIEDNMSIDPAIRTLLSQRVREEDFKLNRLQDEYYGQIKKNKSKS